MSNHKTFFKDQRVVIAGAAGTVGRELVRQILKSPVTEDNNESALFFLGEAYREEPRLH